MPVKTGNPSTPKPMIEMPTFTFQTEMAPPTKTAPTTTAPPYASHLICWRSTLPARRILTMSETADANIEAPAGMAPAIATASRIGLSTPSGNNSNRKVVGTYIQRVHDHEENHAAVSARLPGAEPPASRYPA